MDVVKCIVLWLCILFFFDNSMIIVGYLVNDGEVNLIYFIEFFW